MTSDRAQQRGTGDDAGQAAAQAAALFALAALPNLGSRSAEGLWDAGIRSVAALQASDPSKLYGRRTGRPRRGSALYALIGAQDGCHWQTVRRERRLEILLRLEALGLAPQRAARTSSAARSPERTAPSK